MGLVEECHIESQVAAVLHPGAYFLQVDEERIAFFPEWRLRNALDQNSPGVQDGFPSETLTIVRAPESHTILAIRHEGKRLAPTMAYELVALRKRRPLEAGQILPGRLDQLPAILKEKGFIIQLAN